MISTHQVDLNLPNLPPNASMAHLFPSFGDTSLLSIGQLCDAGCTATFTANMVTIHLDTSVILTGHRSASTNHLWQVDLPLTSPPNLHHAATALQGSPSQLVAFLHAALFSPALSTLSQALRHNLLPNIPGLSSELVARHPPHSIATAKGHLDQVRKNLRSTQPKPTSKPPPSSPSSAFNVSLDPTLETDLDLFPPSAPPGIPTDHCFAAVMESTGQVFTDQTGRFILPSSQGNTQLLILYAYDANYIHAEPMKSKTSNAILNAYKAAHATLVAAGLKPRLQYLDNEASTALKSFLHSSDIDFQLAPPGIHRRNAAERAIRTFKNHFIADPDFPLHLWCRLLPQAIMTLNLLRSSRINPKLSAWAQVHGQFDFNRTPIAPPGIRVVVHDKPSNRKSWAAHGVEGWYVGPAMDSYRCYRVYIPSTNSERITDTLAWFPTLIPMPANDSTSIIQSCLKDILHALQHPSLGSALAPLALRESAQLQQLARLFTPPVTAPDPDPLPNPSPTATPHPDPALSPITAPPPTLHSAQPPPPTQNPAQLLRVSPSSPLPDFFPLPAPALRVVAPTLTNGHHVLLATSSFSIATDLLEALSLPSPPPPAALPGPTDVDTPCYRTAYLVIAKLLGVDPHSLEIVHPTTGHAYKAIHPDTGRDVEYPELLRSSEGILWEESCAEEVGRLADGYKQSTGTNTIKFIRHDQVPANRKATYLRNVVADRPQKAQPRRVRWTVGGNLIDYPGDVSTKTAGLTTAKLVFNSVVSTPHAKFMCMDIKDFYLNTNLPRPEYMKIPISMIPQSIIDQYHLLAIVHNGYVYVEINKGMYGLPQAGRIANDELVPYLAQHGYHQCEHTPGLFRHDTRPILFSLVVDDFGVQYVGRENAEHLAGVIAAKYKMTTDWTGALYCGISLDWDYTNRTVTLSMPGYVAKALQRFEAPKPSRPQNSPSPFSEPIYGRTVQLTPPPDDSALLNKDEITRLQEVIGVFLYYGRAIDNTMLVALGTLAAAQAHGTQATAKAAVHLLNYAATHPDASIQYHASDMCLHVHSDASYLSESQARSRAGGFFFLSNKPSSDPTSPAPPINAPIHIVSNILRNVMASATEAEVGACFHNAQDACPIRTTLIELGWPQPATPIQVDNSCANGIINDTVKQRRSKAIDMRFYWVRDRVRQGQFTVHWKPGIENLADYYTKHFSPRHHQTVRSTYLHAPRAHPALPTNQSNPIPAL
jgi:hypothetical protein